MIEFNCNKCGRKLNVPESHSGEKFKCPNCGGEVVIPGQDEGVLGAGESDAAAGSGISGIDSSLFDVPKKTEDTKDSGTPQHFSAESLKEIQETGGGMDTRQKSPEEATICKLPWFIDVFLYPFSTTGIIHLIGLWLLIFLLCPWVMGNFGLGTEYAPIVYILPVSYMLYYFTECLRDSASGRRRVPELWTRSIVPDRWDCIAQLLVVIGCIAMCFWPVAVYYIATERSDLIYWLLLMCGGFYFPMALLAVVLFDSFNALNPLLVVRSIFSTFIPYCGLIIILFAGSYICLKIDSRFYNFRPMPIVPFFLRAIQLYMINIAVGFLGRFYRRFEKKLNWEV
ncbi:MAG: hypothetical protein JW715_11575 [Sedimentisphaerales bacterium]|nr:hypothetical protein [Sedimentisphaerales bacterium]